MKHVVGIISQAFIMSLTYLTILLSVVFDAIVFGFPFLLIYNYILVSKFNLPEFNYIDAVGIVLLIKLTAVLWKSVKMDEKQEDSTMYDEKLNE